MPFRQASWNKTNAPAWTDSRPIAEGNVNVQLTHCLTRALAVNPNGPICVRSDGSQRSYREGVDRISRLASGLRTIGVQEGDRVGILSLNSEFYLEAIMASIWAGAVYVPLNWRLTPHELSFVMEDAGVGVLFVDDANYGLAQTIAPKPSKWMKTIFIGGNVPGDSSVVGYEDLIQTNAPIAHSDRKDDDLVSLNFTAGTTSRSKGVMLTHDNMFFNAVNSYAGLGLNSDSRYLHSGPMFHLGDGASSFSTTLVGGGHAYVERFDVADCLATIEACKITHAQYVPTMIKLLLDHPDIKTRDMRSLQKILYGASPIEDEALRRAITLLPNTQFIHGYGMTETAGLGTMLAGKYSTVEGPDAGKRRSCGQTCLLSETKIVDDDGNELAPNEIGEIIMRGPQIMKGYWNLPEQTAEALRDGWLHSGDLGYLDEEGFLYISGRKKDMIKTGGENVFAVEVENTIAEIPGVAECAVFGLPDPKWDEIIAAVIVPRAGMTVTEDEVVSFCREHLAPYKTPRVVRIQTEALPQSGAGKIQKREIKEALLASLNDD